MTTTQPPATAPGVAVLATHPDLLTGAHAVSIYPHEVRIQGDLTDVAPAISALARLDHRAAYDPTRGHTDDTGNLFRHYAGHVAGVLVVIVAVQAGGVAVAS